MRFFLRNGVLFLPGSTTPYGRRVTIRRVDRAVAVDVA